MSSLAIIQAAVAEAQALAVVEKELEAAARKEAADKITALQTQVGDLESQISGLQVQLSQIGTALSNVDVESLLSQIGTLKTAITDVSPTAPADPTAVQTIIPAV